MISGPIPSWQIDGETMETETEFIFLGSQITADGDYSQEIKTLAPWKKSYDQPRQQIFFFQILFFFFFLLLFYFTILYWFCHTST